MSSPGAIVREIHRLRRGIKDLTTRIDSGPRQIKAQHAVVSRCEENLKRAQEELKHLKVKTHEKEVSLKATGDQIKKYERQLNEIISKKEYDAFKTELATCRAAGAKLEDEILAALGELEERQAKLPEIEKALVQARAQAVELEKTQESRMAELSRQRDELQKQLAEVEGTLPADIRPPYDRLIVAKGEDAMAAVEGRTCVACYTEITAQNTHDLNQGKFLLCKSCGRILYLPEGP
jgi:hypothetical protein